MPVNRILVKSLSDEQLTNFLKVSISEDKLTDSEFLINELSRRLKNKIELFEDVKKELTNLRKIFTPQVT